MLLHNDIGICEECAQELDQDDFRGCAVCELKKEIIILRVKIKSLEVISKADNIEIKNLKNTLKLSYKSNSIV